MIIINSHSKRSRIIICIKNKTIIIYGPKAARVHIRLVNRYLLNVPSVSSPYFNKTKRMSRLGKWHALSLEIPSYVIQTLN